MARSTSKSLCQAAATSISQLYWRAAAITDCGFFFANTQAFNSQIV